MSGIQTPVNFLLIFGETTRPKRHNFLLNIKYNHKINKTYKSKFFYKPMNYKGYIKTKEDY